MSAPTNCAAPRASSEPQQLTMIDTPAEPPALRLAVAGVLHRRPELRHAADGSVHLFLHLRQPGAADRCLPFVGLLHAPAIERAAVEQLAARLHLGSTVLLRGRGLAVSHHHGELALELQRCESVSELAFDQPASPTAGA